MNDPDMLAEIELTMVPSGHGCPAPTRDPAGALRTRRFWCAVKKQHVEVEFETRAVLGFRRIAGVRRCSALDEPEKVACGRYCLESKFRSQWPYALPLAGYRVAR
jgi:hypothetical protein